MKVINKEKLTVPFVRLVGAVHESVTHLTAADTRPSIGAGLLSSRAVGQTGAGSDAGAVEASATFTRPPAGIGQTQVETSTIVVGAAIGPWRK